jgi:hypothetical protein
MVYYQSNNEGAYERTPTNKGTPTKVSKGPAPINLMEGFLPQFVDGDNRDYQIMDSGAIFDDYMSRGELLQYRWENPHRKLVDLSGKRLGNEVNMGSQLLIFQLPRSDKPQGKAKLSTPDEPLRPPNPSEDGGMLWLTHLITKRRCRITYEVVVWSPKRRRQGYIFCSTFVLLDDHD